MQFSRFSYIITWFRDDLAKLVSPAGISITFILSASVASIYIDLSLWLISVVVGVIILFGTTIGSLCIGVEEFDIF
jgi:hypothetical protein